MINFQCLNLESGRWPHSKLAKLLNFQQIICWWLISELVCWCLNEMAHIITCGCCGKTWPLVSSCGICIYSFMRLRTYAILGEQLRWCWTICHSYFVFIADICMCVLVVFWAPICDKYVHIYVCLCICICGRRQWACVFYHCESQFVTNTSVYVTDTPKPPSCSTIDLGCAIHNIQLQIILIYWKATYLQFNYLVRSIVQAPWQFSGCTPSCSAA